LQFGWKMTDVEIAGVEENPVSHGDGVVSAVMIGLVLLLLLNVDEALVGPIPKLVHGRDEVVCGLDCG
ncbi:hypothetical protein CLOM_g9482, partial [Closterium sp. NIES-68]